MAKKSTRKASTRKSMPDRCLTRIRALQKRIRKCHAAALLVTNPRDIRYLTGFVGEDSWALIQASSTKVHILSDSRFTEQIKREAPHAHLRLRKTTLVDELERLVDEEGLHPVALQSAYVTLAQHTTLEKKLEADWIKCVEDGLLEQRAIKDKSEVTLIRKAGKIQQQAFENLLETLEPGQTENEIAARLEYEMRMLGADGPSFSTIVAVGANAALPHAIPGQTRLRRNEILLIDWGARYGGYCSDMTRVVALGRMPTKMREVYQIVLDAQLAGIAAIKPGVALQEVDAAARRVIEKAGYAEYFGHGLGHGLGLNIHEQPSLSPRAKGELKPGHVVTVEPGIYLPGIGGVRIEDDVLVTERGGRLLTSLPKDLNSAII